MKYRVAQSLGFKKIEVLYAKSGSNIYVHIYYNTRKQNKYHNRIEYKADYYSGGNDKESIIGIYVDPVNKLTEGLVIELYSENNLEYNLFNGPVKIISCGYSGVCFMIMPQITHREWCKNKVAKKLNKAPKVKS